MPKRLILFLLLFQSVVAFSQTFYGGINAGFNISQVDGDTRGGYNTGYPTGGLYVRNTVGAEQRSSFSLGIYYRHKGSKQVIKDNYGNVSKYFHISLDYIEIPVIYSYYLKALKIPHLVNYKFKNKLFLQIGLSYGYLAKAKINEGNGFMEPARPFNKYETATHIGLNYYITDHWFLNYRFSYTLFFLPIRQHPGGQTYRLNRGQYNNVMIFSAGYEF